MHGLNSLISLIDVINECALHLSTGTHTLHGSVTGFTAVNETFKITTFLKTKQHFS